MSKYVINLPGGRVAQEFDSMTEAELYALEHNLCRYTVQIVKPETPLREHDLGGES